MGLYLQAAVLEKEGLIGLADKLRLADNPVTRDGVRFTPCEMAELARRGISLGASVEALPWGGGFSAAGPVGVGLSIAALLGMAAAKLGPALIEKLKRFHPSTPVSSVPLTPEENDRIAQAIASLHPLTAEQIMNADRLIGPGERDSRRDPRFPDVDSTFQDVSDEHVADIFQATQNIAMQDEATLPPPGDPNRCDELYKLSEAWSREHSLYRYLSFVDPRYRDLEQLCLQYANKYYLAAEKEGCKGDHWPFNFKLTPVGGGMPLGASAEALPWGGGFSAAGPVGVGLSIAALLGMAAAKLGPALVEKLKRFSPSTPVASVPLTPEESIRVQDAINELNISHASLSGINNLIEELFNDGLQFSGDPPKPPYDPCRYVNSLWDRYRLLRDRFNTLTENSPATNLTLEPLQWLLEELDEQFCPDDNEIPF